MITFNFQVQTRVPILTLSGHTEAVSGVTWLGEQEVCTASWDHTLRLWDLEKAEQKASMVRGWLVGLRFMDCSATVNHDHL